MTILFDLFTIVGSVLITVVVVHYIFELAEEGAWHLAVLCTWPLVAIALLTADKARFAYALVVVASVAMSSVEISKRWR